MYGHIQKLAEAEKEGLKKVGIEADLYQYASNYAFTLVTPVLIHLTQSSRDSPSRGLDQDARSSKIRHPSRYC